MNQPYVPGTQEFAGALKEVFARKWLTNFGEAHKAFEEGLRRYLGCEHVLPVTNATMGLFTVLRALDVRGEVITTPVTFPATYPVLMNLPDVTPVFVDVSRKDFCISPEAVRAAITPETAAILPVHAYAFPCDVDKLGEIAEESGVKLVYDAAPAIGVKLRGTSIVSFGDASVLSFHATKGLSTGEGGAIVCRTKELYDRCRFFINFGIRSEEEIDLPGLNAKLDEIRSVMGIFALRDVDKGIAARKAVVERYIEFFRSSASKGIVVPYDVFDSPDIEHGYAYFPVVVEPGEALSRDTLYAKLRERGIIARKYYYPTVLDLPIYEKVSMRVEDVTNAAFLSKNVLCLPVNHYFSDSDCDDLIGHVESCLRELGQGRSVRT